MEKSLNSIKPGTIWKLGEHRLAFGDCRNKELLKRLIGKEKINLLCCDIPYACAAVESKRGFYKLSKDKTIANDQLQTDEEYRAFNREWLEAVKPFLAKKNSAYIFNADKMVWSLRGAMIESGFKVAQLLIWVKSQAVVGRLDYAPAHVLILSGGMRVYRTSRTKLIHELGHSRDDQPPLGT